MNFADRVERVEPSATVAIGNKARELEESGVDVVDLSVGEPDFPTPPNVVEAAEEAIEAGNTGYTASNGIRPLREAIADKLAADGLDHGPEDVIVTPGAKLALFETVSALVDEGDEVVLFDPAWVSYEAMVKLAGGDPVRVDLSPHDFRLEPALEEFEAAVGDDTALVVLNSPTNPTGAVFSDAALRGVRDVAVEADVPVVADEIYGEITYGVEPTSVGSLDGMADRTITVNGFSKAYSMTGWRLGYLAGPEELVAQAGKVHSHSATCAANFVQHAGVEALRNTDDAVGEMVDSFRERRDALVEMLGDRGVDLPAPDGAFYAMIPVEGDDWAERALEEAAVATVPGEAFGAPGYVRVSYAAAMDRIREGVERLDDAGLL